MLLIIWAQHAASSLYPLFQNLEISLRNAIDSAARKRFGDYWWDKITVTKGNLNETRFRRNIHKAVDSLYK